MRGVRCGRALVLFYFALALTSSSFIASTSFFQWWQLVTAVYATGRLYSVGGKVRFKCSRLTLLSRIWFTGGGKLCNGRWRKRRGGCIVPDRDVEQCEPLFPRSIYINSPGGVVTVGLAIYDTMQYIRSPVSMLCVGQAASMGSLLLAVEAPGERRSLPNGHVMIHQPSDGASGQASDIAIQASEILDMRARLSRLYVKHTCHTFEKIEMSMEQDHFMSHEEAKLFGLVDEVIERRPETLAADSLVLKR